MRNNSMFRVWVEASLAVLTGLLGILTVLWRDWIEGLTGWNPDHHSGAIEIGLITALLAVSVTCGAAARRTYRRLAALSG